MNNRTFDPSLLESIPPDVYDASRKVSLYFATMGVRDWSLNECCSRSRVEILEHVLRSIVSDLPSKRDWLDPATEKVARDLLGM